MSEFQKILLKARQERIALEKLLNKSENIQPEKQKSSSDIGFSVKAKRFNEISNFLIKKA